MWVWRWTRRALEPKHQNHQRQFWSPSLMVAEGIRAPAAVAATWHTKTQGCLYGGTSHGDCSWSLHKSRCWKSYTLQWPPCRKDYLLCGLSDQTSGVLSLCVSCRKLSPGLPSLVYTDPACTLQTQPKSALRAQTSGRSRLTLQGMLKVEDWFA